MEKGFVEIPIWMELAEDEAPRDIGNVGQGLDVNEGGTGSQRSVGKGPAVEVQAKRTEQDSGATRQRPVPPSRPPVRAPPQSAAPAPTTVDIRRAVEGAELGDGEALDVPSGIFVTNRLIDQLRTKATQSRQKLSKEEQSIWGRWQKYVIDKPAPAPKTRTAILTDLPADQYGRGHRVSKPSAGVAAALVGKLEEDEPKSWQHAMRGKDGLDCIG